MIMVPYLALSFVLFSVPYAVTARAFRNTGGSIVLEEAWTIPSLVNDTSLIPPFNQTSSELVSNILDIHNQRLAFMNENDIDFMVISCASPCVQGISDTETAQQQAVQLNNILAQSISNSTDRFGAFAALAMQDPAVAAQELRRTVTELGFLGALVNDYQQSGPDGMTLLYYDQPEYDVFWETVTELDVPVYFHPRSNIPEIITLEYAHAIWLEGPAQEFAATLSTHILGVITNGVFDRFPTLKVIVGHLGERIPSDFFRIDEQLRRQLINGLPMLRNASDYWRTNLWETTSGNFATPLLQFHINQIGIDRILFSIDYPYVPIPEGAAWLDTLTSVLNEQDFLSVKRNLAIQLLKLDQ
ncbi:amidohydrolase 2 [Pluteus cervinus]|uniref:Amidohydrolase 2 n=1 Tax=Pluteus cervinus TaxID=181527 RepID=A0ACD3AU01_9AGAR|nr:amidohydrolase 2 [Pluteus cervinus]